MKYPSVSIVMPSLNSSRTLEACLRSIREQNYVQGDVEILLVDGGSGDSTKEIGSKYGCRFIEGGYRDNQEARKGIGLHEARNEYVAYIDTDNILPDRAWMGQMVRPFMDDSTIVGTEAWRYGVEPDFPPFSRYCALLGANDPVVYYLGKCDKLSWLYDDWVYTKKVEDRGEYVVVEFDECNLPTMGGNGFFIKRETLLKSRCGQGEFFHIDVVLDLVRLGYTRFAMVKSEIYHDTAASLIKLTGRRMTYFREHNPSHSERRYLIFNHKNRKDLLKMGLFVFFTLTFIEPLLFSVRGFMKKKDLAWFLHPLACFAFLVSYAFATLNMKLSDEKL